MNKLGKLTLAAAIVLWLASPAIAEIKEKTCAEVNAKLGDLPTQTLQKLKASYEIRIKGNSELEAGANRANEETASCIWDILQERNKFSTLSEESLKQIIASYSIKVNWEWELARAINASHAQTVLLVKQELESRK